MPIDTRQIKVLISCPDDVGSEQKIIRVICDSLTRAWRTSRSMEVIPVDWKNEVVHVITGERPQEIIKRQAVDYDIYVGILWKRFGDKQDINGLTPTEEEFEDALKRCKETGRPVIKFFFKSEPYRHETFYDLEQAGEVLKFKDRIKKLGLYDEFEGPEEFQQKVWEGLLWIIEEFDSLTARTLPLQKGTFHDVSHYITRKAFPINKEQAARGAFDYELARPVTDLVEKDKRIVLLAGAGVGKTVELQHIAAHFSAANLPLYPYFAPLNRYVNQSLPELLHSDWARVPPNQLLVLLDGLDEIESKNRNDAIRQIESFAEAYPDARIIISCRTNSYRAKTEDWPGTLEGFTCYRLLDLDRGATGAYIMRMLGAAGDKFYKQVYANKLQDLLNIPFYLIRLVELFEKDHQLPASKSDLFDTLLYSRVRSDETHYRKTIDLDDQRQRLITELERLALGMEMLGRSYITDDEFQELVRDDDRRSLVRLSGFFYRNEQGTVTWQFEHNNFQEYLAARALSHLSFDAIKEYVSF